MNYFLPPLFLAERADISNVASGSLRVMNDVLVRESVAMVAPASLANLTVDVWLNISSPLTEDGGYDRCNVFAVAFEEVEDAVRPPEDTETVPCTRWEYDESFLQV